MGKDYTKWHGLKTKIEQSKRLREFSEREIWWCSISYNIGVETDSKKKLFERPVLVFKKFNSQMLWALPMTSQIRYGRYFLQIPVLGYKRTIMLSQLKIISAQRLNRKITRISKKEYWLVTRSIIKLIKRAP